MNASHAPSDKPKYLLLTLEFPPFKGGIANYLFGLCNNLPAKNLTVLTPRIDGSSCFDRTVGFKIKRAFIPKFEIQFATSALAVLIFTFHTLLISFKEKIKGVFCDHFIPLGIVGYLMKRLFGLPYGLIFHGGDLLKFPERGFKRHLAIRVIKESERLIVSSNYAREQLIKLGLAPEGRITVLYPGIEFTKFTSEFQSATDNRYLSPIIRGRQVLLTVARLVPHKGIDVVVKSLKYIIAEVPDLIYLVVGEGKDRERLEEIVKTEGLDKYVIFLGKISDEEVIEYYRICDVFIQVSRLTEGEVEGFGITFLEANAFGKPVIGGNSGGISEAVIDNKTGFLVDPSDPSILAQRVVELLINKDLANRFGIHGRERVKRFFSWEERGVELEAILDLESPSQQLCSDS